MINDPIVLSGVGVVTSLGWGTDQFWSNLLAGAVGSRPVSLFDTSDCRRAIACEVTGLPKHGTSETRADRLLQYALVEAMKDARLSKQPNVGLILATTHGDPERSFDSRVLKLLENSRRTVGGKGLDVSVVSACAAGNLALVSAHRLISLGKADVCVIAGIEVLHRLPFVGFSSMHVMAANQAQPFDVDRSGLLLGEGAAALVVERMSNAQKRDCRPYAQIAGYGITCDAIHLVKPSWEWQATAMRDALKMAEVSSTDVDYINAHGTGTKSNDHSELIAIEELWSTDVPVSSIKGQIGHALGAASAIEAVACSLALRKKILPGNATVDNPEPTKHIRLLPKNPEPVEKLQIILSNAFAFGGVNSCLALRSC